MIARFKKLVGKITVYDDAEPVEIRTYRKDAGAPFEITVDDVSWTTCENGVEVDEEIKDIISLYHYNFFPRF